MSLRVSGKNLDIGDALRTHVETRLGDMLARYTSQGTGQADWREGVQGHVLVEKHGTEFRTECLIHLSAGLTLQAEAQAHDAHASVDGAAERIATRLKRHRERSRRHEGGDPPALDGREGSDDGEPSDLDEALVSAEGDGDGVAVDDFAPAIVSEKLDALESLPVAEAAVRLDRGGANALVFRHAGHGRVNVVYRRADGHIGWIDIAGAAEAAG